MALVLKVYSSFAQHLLFEYSFKVTVYSVLINIHNKQYYLLELLQRHK